jgi:hypothetical protein
MNWYKIAQEDLAEELEQAMGSDKPDKPDKPQEHDLDCPECGAKLELIPKSPYGPYYRCEDKCGVTHGANKDGSPIGIPGDLETMALRKAAHAKFDQLWKNEPNPKEARNKAYYWLSRKMGCHRNQCHMAQFNKTQLRQVISLSEYQLQKKRKREQKKDIQPELF